MLTLQLRGVFKALVTIFGSVDYITVLSFIWCFEHLQGFDFGFRVLVFRISMVWASECIPVAIFRIVLCLHWCILEL